MLTSPTLLSLKWRSIASLGMVMGQQQRFLTTFVVWSRIRDNINESPNSSMIYQVLAQSHLPLLPTTPIYAQRPPLYTSYMRLRYDGSPSAQVIRPRRIILCVGVCPFSPASLDHCGKRVILKRIHFRYRQVKVFRIAHNHPLQIREEVPCP